MGTCHHAVPQGYIPDWRCQRRRFHVGRHRSRNYTRPRFPRFWRIDMWRRTRAANRRIRNFGPDAKLISHRAYLFPSRFDPVSVTRSTSPISA
jgi:hypothetical protein